MSNAWGFSYVLVLPHTPNEKAHRMAGAADELNSAARSMLTFDPRCYQR
jgi:hypothetical protein